MSKVMSNIPLPAASAIGLRAHYADVASRLRTRLPMPPRRDYEPDGTIRIVECKPYRYDAFGSALFRPRGCIIDLALSEHEKVCLFLESIHALRSNYLSPLNALIKSLTLVFGISSCEIKSDQRVAHLVRVRSVGMAAAHRLHFGSLPKIGRAFGGRDHTTVLHAARGRYGDLVDAALQNYPEFLPTA